MLFRSFFAALFLLYLMPLLCDSSNELHMFTYGEQYILPAGNVLRHYNAPQGRFSQAKIASHGSLGGYGSSNISNQVP